MEKMDTGRPIVMYHDNCTDGFGAAFASWLYMKNDADYFPVKYDDPIPKLPVDEDGKSDQPVYIFDFSFSLETIREMKKIHPVVEVHDHHKTALHLKDEPGCVIDMERSGAVLAWNRWFPGHAVPQFFQYIQDRDLWKWEMYRSRAVSAGLQSHPMDFSTWNYLFDKGSVTRFNSKLYRLAEDGDSILRSHQSLVERASLNAHVGLYQMIIEGELITFPAVNSCLLQSELGEFLLKKYPHAPFAGIYYENENSDGESVIHWSLRSQFGRRDVSEIAQHFGGGGHRNASGFTYPLLGRGDHLLVAGK